VVFDPYLITESAIFRFIRDLGFIVDDEPQ
jgi:hypothetical protein